MAHTPLKQTKKVQAPKPEVLSIASRMAVLQLALAKPPKEERAPTPPGMQQLLLSHQAVFAHRTEPMNVPPVKIPMDHTKPLPQNHPPVGYHHSPDDMVILDEDHQANLENGVIERPKEAGAFCSPKFVARDPQNRHRPRVVYNTQFPNRWLQVLQQPSSPEL
jgi:hypothetical protein